MSLIRQITVPMKCVDCSKSTQFDYLCEYDIGYFCKDCWKNFVKEYSSFLMQQNEINAVNNFEVFLKQKYGLNGYKMFINKKDFQLKLDNMLSDYLSARL